MLTCTKKLRARTEHTGQAIQHAAYLPKPQLLFPTKPDNSDRPWHHSVKHKYHAQVPLGYVFRDDTVDEDRTAEELSQVALLLHSKPVLIGHYSNHPYFYEIKHIAYPSHIFTSRPPIQYKPMDKTPLNWVRTAGELEAMLEKLRQSQEIGVDLEHHDYRTYGGFLCLMQISTREEDWLVDLLVLRDEIQSLNEVFADPSIVKVLRSIVFSVTIHSYRNTGIPRCGQRHCVVTTELRCVCSYPFRHVSCIQAPR